MDNYQIIYDVRVPNIGPDNAKIVCIGESPGEDEERLGIPFSGQAGTLLEQVINRHGIAREEVYLCNLSQLRPRNNKFFHLYGTRQLHEGKQSVRDIIYKVKPNVIVPLGNEALEFICGRKGIHKWRGSIINGQNEFSTYKVIPTYHPSFVLRDQTNLPTFDMDWSRISRDQLYPDLRYEKRDYFVNPLGMQLEELVAEYETQETLSVDIETTREGTRKIICVGFAKSPLHGISIFLDSEHQRSCIQRLLLCNAKKVFHFGIFDRCKLADDEFSISGPFGDTFIGQQTLNAGLPNGLDYLTSIYTREPYYKSEGRAEIPDDTKVWSATTDKSKLGIYNCKDVVCTYEIFTQQQSELVEDKLINQYENKIEQLAMAIDISRTGITVDIERKTLFRKALYNKWSKLQWALNILGKADPKKGINVQSPKLKTFLYGNLGLPEKRKRNNKGEWVVTTDDDALVSLIAFTKQKIQESKKADTIKVWEVKNAIVTTIHRIRGIRKLLSSYVEIDISSDNRIRSMYKVSGTETDRWSCNKYIDDTGVNAQTFYRGVIGIPDDVEESINIDAMLAELKKDKEVEEVKDDEPVEMA